MPDSNPPAPTTVKNWIDNEIGDERTLIAVIEGGEGEHSWYYLPLWVGPHQEHDDLEMVDLRYVQWPAEGLDEMQPTMMKNGIKMRDDGSLLVRLVRAVARARNAQSDPEMDTDDPLWLGK